MKGAPLMRLFRTSKPARTAEDEAAAVRLAAIANRSKALASPMFSTEASSETIDPQAEATLQ